MFKKFLKGISKEMKKMGSGSGRKKHYRHGSSSDRSRYRRHGSSSGKKRRYYGSSSSGRRGRDAYRGSHHYKRKGRYSSS